MSVSKHTTFLYVPYMKKFNVKSFLFVGIIPPQLTPTEVFFCAKHFKYCESVDILF